MKVPTEPVRYVGWICLHCGSHTPEIPTSRCSHHESVEVCDWRPDIVDRAARIKDLQRELDAARASLADLAEMEVMAGRARRVRDDGEVCAKRNVEFLRVVESGEAVWWHRGRFVTRDGRARWRPLPRKSDGQFRTPTEDFPQGGANVFLLDPA